MLPPPTVDGVPIASPAGDALLQLLNDLAEHASTIEHTVVQTAGQVRRVATNDLAGEFVRTHHRTEEAVVVALHRITRNLEARKGVLYTLAAIFYVGSGLALLVLWPLHCACKQLLIHGDRARMATIVVAAATAIGAIGTLAAAIGGHR